MVNVTNGTYVYVNLATDKLLFCHFSILCEQYVDAHSVDESKLERAAGIEPVSQAWKAWVITIIRCPQWNL